MGKADRKTTNRGGDQGGGQKTAFTMEQVQLILSLLKAKGDVMQIALLSTAVSTCLRSGDLLGLKVSKVKTPNGAILDRFTVKQEKTGEPVTCTLSDACRTALAAWIDASGRELDMPIFTVGREQYARIVKEWARMAHLDPGQYSTHSLRRTQAAHLYKKTGNLKAVSMLLGHKSLAHTTEYLGVDIEDALKLKEEHRIL